MACSAFDKGISDLEWSGEKKAIKKENQNAEPSSAKNEQSSSWVMNSSNMELSQ